MTPRQDVFYLFDKSHKTFLPADIMNLYEIHNITQEDIDISFSGPRHPKYWDAWLRIIKNGQIEIDERYYNLHWIEDDGLFAVPIDYDWEVDPNKLS